MRTVHFVLTALFTAAVIVQFYLAGVGVFSMPEDELFAIHGWNGRIVLSLLVLLNLGAAALARAGTVKAAAGLLGLLALQPVWFIVAGVLTGATPPPDPQVNTAATILLSLHVVIGLTILYFSVRLLRRTYTLAFPQRQAAIAGSDEQATTTRLGTPSA